MAAPAVDLGRGQLTVFPGDDDRAAQPRVRVEPLGLLPFIGGASKGGAEVQVALIAGADQRIEDAELHSPFVEQLRLEEGKVGAGGRAVLRPGVVAGGVGHRAWIVAALVAALPDRTVVLLPAFAQVAAQDVGRGEIDMDVGIDDGRIQPRAFGGAPGCGRAWHGAVATVAVALDGGAVNSSGLNWSGHGMPPAGGVRE